MVYSIRTMSIFPYFCLLCFVSKGQVMYTANSGYGVPMAMPMEAGGGMVVVQAATTGTQGGQPQMVMVPVSGAMGNQHHYAPQAAQHGASGYQYQQVQMPPAYGQEQRVTLENEQVKLELKRVSEGVKGRLAYFCSGTGIWSPGIGQKMWKMRLE